MTQERATPRRWLGALVLGLAGLGVYVWPALTAPVIRWSDSEIDLGWARAGVPFAHEATAVASERFDHSVKVGYIAFLRAAMSLFPALGEARSIVVVQSLLLWLSICLTAVYLYRRSPRRWIGPVAFVLILSFLRLRDASSAVMSEAITATIALPLAATALFPASRTRTWFFTWGVGCGVLFWVRPNVGLIVFGVGIAVLLAAGRALMFVVLGFATVVVPVWWGTHPRHASSPFQQVAVAVWAGSFDYYVPLERPETVTRMTTASAMLSEAATNWHRFLRRRGFDFRRQLVWRGLHGLLGTEFYDPRWSRPYRLVDTATRVLAPLLIIGAVAILFTMPFPRQLWSWNVAGIVLVLGIVGQNLVLGSLPRFVLPLLPVLLVLAVAGLSAVAKSRWRCGIAGILVVAGCVGAAGNRGVLAWQEGEVETSGVEIVQRIPRGALPKGAPATLHVRIQPGLLPSTAHLDILGPEDETLYRSSSDARRDLPVIAVPIPDSLLRANQRAAIDLRLVSAGDYGATDFLYFPVVPVPWGTPARRTGSPELSPSTAIAAGSLDWWAHAGVP